MYIVGIELLDDSHRPVEHLSYEEFEEVERELAFAMYNNYQTDKYTAKYILQKKLDNTFIVLDSENYLEEKEI